MPIIKSAKKRVRVSAKAAVRNAKTKRTMREAIKTFNESLSSGKADKIYLAQSKALSAIDIATKKNVIHKNKAARKKKQLNEAIKKASIKKPALIAKKAAKPEKTKKTITKKTSAKKTQTKKSITKNK